MYFAYSTLDGPAELSATAQMVIEELQILLWDRCASSTHILRTGFKGRWRGFLTPDEGQLQCIECVYASCGAERDRRIRHFERVVDEHGHFAGRVSFADSTPSTSEDDMAIVD